MLPIGPQLPGGPTAKDMTREQALYGARSDGAQEWFRRFANVSWHSAAARAEEKKKNMRVAGGRVWQDESLAEWNEHDFRIFVGDLGNEVNEDVLQKAFAHYPSLDKVKVIRDKVTGKSKGFGFVSLLDPIEFLNALKEMNGTYIGNRPCKLKKSNWKQRDMDERMKKDKKGTVDLIVVQSKGTGQRVKKRKARPENANRDAKKQNPGAVAPAPNHWQQ
jgi:RNA recognition motif-containing protein